ncbi:4'-phosphopantetheinyl transferase [Planotetraspora sp. GP83]|uniref:4'-phosphopantetheinyl transferase family protein n=1 Tax=Planotetraspora sp. GP83 TaxID=3156264 RepID=UPI003512073E
MIGALLPDKVATAWLDDFTLAGLPLPEESAAPPDGRPPGASRALEFRAGRHCARTALTRLGVAPAPVPRGPDRAPRWPEGVVGSITHCRGYCAAAVARSSAFTAIGIDAEPDEPLPSVVLRRIALPAELRALPTGAAWGRLLFSAKESVYKVWAPATGRWLGFDEAEVRFDPPAGRFEASVLVPPFPTYSGRFLVSSGLALTAIAVQEVEKDEPDRAAGAAGGGSAVADLGGNVHA